MIFVNTNKSSNLASATTYKEFQLEHIGIYGISNRKASYPIPCNSGCIPTDAAVFIKLLSMQPKKFCSKGNTHASTCAHDTSNIIHQFIDFVAVKDVKTTLLNLLVQYFQHQDIDGEIYPEHQQKVLWHFQLLLEHLESLHELQNRDYEPTN